MKHSAKVLQNTLLSIFLAASLHSVAFAAGKGDNFWVYPVIEGYGRIHPLPDAAMQPDPETTYKVVFTATKGKEKDGVNASLWRVARAVNVFGQAGVKQDHRDFVVVISGKATPLIMSNQAYKAKHGKDNPNLKLIKALQDAGVKLQVCGQAVAENKIDYKAINPDITLTLSALSDVPMLQAQGYSLFPL